MDTHTHAHTLRHCYSWKRLTPGSRLSYCLTLILYYAVLWRCCDLTHFCWNCQEPSISLINFTRRCDWNSRRYLTHHYIETVSTVVSPPSHHAVFEFHLSVTKERVFHSPTPAPPETAEGISKEQLAVMYISATSFSKLYLKTLFSPPLSLMRCSGGCVVVTLTQENV